jgi:hypothetical protein
MSENTAKPLSKANLPSSAYSARSSRLSNVSSVKTEDEPAIFGSLPTKTKGKKCPPTQRCEWVDRFYSDTCLLANHAGDQV